MDDSVGRDRNVRVPRRVPRTVIDEAAAQDQVNVHEWAPRQLHLAVVRRRPQ
jgi:hypothetical protein